MTNPAAGTTLKRPEFRGAGRPATAVGMIAACDALEVQPADLWAVLAVESRGFGFQADRRPQILFERHVFHRLTGGEFDATHPAISNVIPGGYTFGAGEYLRLQSAIELDRDAALQSTSWGIGQIMGFNAGLAGFPSAEAMVAAVVQDEDAQLLAVAAFLDASGLKEALQRQDWQAFARKYNGPEYARNNYIERLLVAWIGFQRDLPDLTVRDAQAALLYLGFEIGRVDGVAGPLTATAVRQFQRQCGLAVSGALDPTTTSAIAGAAFPE